MMTRNKELDIAKGIAAWLVIWGHTIQVCYAGDEAFYENIIFRFIYGFHMPFFMIISGYLFFMSCKSCDLKEIMKKQFSHIMYPVLVWNGMHWIFKLCYTKGAEMHSIEDFAISLYKSLTGLWFLWSVFIISVLIAIIYYNVTAGGKRAIGYIIAFCILLMIPEGIEPVKTMNIWMYPYFLTGFIWSEKKKSFMKRKILEYGFVILYPALIHYFHFRDYIYTSGIALFHSEYGFAKQIQIDIYRWILGYAGIIFMTIILNKLLQKANIKEFLYVLFGKLGQVTLQLYVLQRLLLTEIFGRGYKLLVNRGGVKPLTSNIWLYNLVWTPIIGLLNLFIIYKIIIVIRNNSKLSRYLFAIRLRQ